MEDRPSFWGRYVAVYCEDHHRSMRFYVEILGAKVLPADGIACPWLRLGDITITLIPNAESKSPSHFPENAMLMIGLTVNDLAKVHGYLVSNRVPIVDYGEDTFLIIADPDGVLIEIQQTDAEFEEKLREWSS